MPCGTRSYEMERRLVAMGHEVNMVTSWREADGRMGWFVTNEAGIKVHWLHVPYPNLSNLDYFQVERKKQDGIQNNLVLHNMGPERGSDYLVNP